MANQLLLLRNDWNSYSASLKLSAEMETFLFPWFWSCCLVVILLGVFMLSCRNTSYYLDIQMLRVRLELPRIFPDSCSGPPAANSCTEKKYLVWLATYLSICSERGYTWQERSWWILALFAVVCLGLQEPYWTYWKPIMHFSHSTREQHSCSMGCEVGINLWKNGLWIW